MTAAQDLFGGSPRSAGSLLRAYADAHPELGAAAATVLAWVLLVLLHTPGLPHDGVHATHHHGVPAPAGDASGLAAIPLGLPAWVLMTMAMMGAPLLPAVRHVAENSLCWRRQRAIATFLAAYVAVWALFGVAAIAAVTAWAPADRLPLLAVVLVLAAAWQLTPWKRAALRACHRAVPLPPRGVKATLADVRFGRQQAFACVGSCWLLMLSMAVATTGHLALTSGLAAVVTAERVLPRPRRVTRVVAAVMAAAALVVIAR